MLANFFSILPARIIHEYRRETFETEARRGFSHVRPTQAYWQSVEEAEREKPRRARGSDEVAGIHELSGLEQIADQLNCLFGRGSGMDKMRREIFEQAHPGLVGPQQNHGLLCLQRQCNF